ncbi:response regulator transcription factor [Domibacillus sp. 8LH]|uniref:response regulator transcription factor n=1 Tax=Domibacillus sp. 8LH TaxID=3073900 RepID=UPI00317857D4
MYKVLVVEEKRAVLDEFCRVLEPNEVSCIRIHSAEEALHIVHNEWIDLVILDILLPSLLWIQLCEKIKECSIVPIVIMTETYDKIFILQALNAGADDVVTKCMDIDILIAKTKAHLRRSASSNPKELYFKGIVLNRELLEIQYEGNLLPFTRKEYALIEYFLNHPNQVIKRKKLLSHLWDGYQHIDARTVDSHIRNIRMKFREVGFPIDEFLRTARGIGYLWKINVEDSNQKWAECHLKEKSSIDHKLIKLN